MCKCVKLRILWDFLDEVMALLNINYSFLRKRPDLYEFEVMNIHCERKDIKIILYLNTIVNYHLWKARNRCIYDGVPFEFNDFIGRLIKSVSARKRLQSYIIQDDRKVDRIGEILSSMIFIQDASYIYDNG